jgi:hypothetical protein
MDVHMLAASPKVENFEPPWIPHRALTEQTYRAHFDVPAGERYYRGVRGPAFASGTELIAVVVYPAKAASGALQEIDAHQLVGRTPVTRPVWYRVYQLSHQSLAGSTMIWIYEHIGQQQKAATTFV